MRILITTGGSGGHIFPALELAKHLRACGHEVIFAGALTLALERIKKQGFTAYQIDAKGLEQRSFSGVISFTLKMVQALWHAQRLLNGIRPDKVIGFGGYGSFAVIAMARFLKIPAMIHEQNVVPGKANRLMGRLVSKVAISFKDSAPYFKKVKTVWTGCPCFYAPSQLSREALLSQFNLDQGKKVILVLGGSQGAQKLNEVVYQMMEGSASELQVQLIHMTGQREYEAYARAYQQKALPAKVYAFIDDIQSAYAIADVVIARSGASTVTELGLLGKPAILVPYPFAGNHQQYNAAVLVNQKAARMVSQYRLTPAVLGELVKGVLAENLSQGQRQDLVKGILRLDAAQALAKEVESL